jgi:hypothetical protein
MPLYYFGCPDSSCAVTTRRLLPPKEVRLAEETCPKCGKLMLRQANAPTARVTEVIDNGIMTRRLERLADAERLFTERNEAVKKQSNQQ